jgi:hypothetical protein
MVVPKEEEQRCYAERHPAEPNTDNQRDAQRQFGRRRIKDLRSPYHRAMLAGSVTPRKLPNSSRRQSRAGTISGGGSRQV